LENNEEDSLAVQSHESVNEVLSQIKENSQKNEKKTKYFLNEWKKEERNTTNFDELLFYAQNSGFISFKTTQYSGSIEKLFVCKTRFYKKNNCESKILIKCAIEKKSPEEIIYGKAEIYNNDQQHLETCAIEAASMWKKPNIKKLILASENTKVSTLINQINSNLDENEQIPKNFQNKQKIYQIKSNYKKILNEKNPFSVIHTYEKWKEYLDLHTFNSNALKLLDFDERKVFILDQYFEKNNFCVSFSTKTLIKNAIFQSLYDFSLICIDGTYKLIKQGYPLIIMTTTDKQYHGHQIAFALVNEESQKNFEFFFNSINKQLLNIDDYSLNHGRWLTSNQSSFEKCLPSDQHRILRLSF